MDTNVDMSHSHIDADQYVCAFTRAAALLHILTPNEAEELQRR